MGTKKSDAPGQPPIESAGSVKGDQPYHLDPIDNLLSEIVTDFQKHDFKEATANLKQLQDADKQLEEQQKALTKSDMTDWLNWGPSYQNIWQHHIDEINASVKLANLGVQDAGQILGVDADGHLITVDSKNPTQEQLRSPQDLSIHSEQVLAPQYWFQPGNTAKYEERLAQAQEMAAHPQPKGNSADEVHQIIDDFHNGKVKEATAGMYKLQKEDDKIEPQAWIRHIAAINANIDLSKLGIKDAPQILGADGKGNLITASQGLLFEQIRSPNNLSSVVEQKGLAFIWRRHAPLRSSQSS